MADMRRAAPPEAMKYLIHHTFLPPKLPGGNNSKAEHESILLNTVVDSLKAFRECVAHDLRDTLESVTVMTTNLCTIHGSSGIHGSVREGPFLNALQNLPNKGKDLSRTPTTLDKSLTVLLKVELFCFT